MQTNEITPSAMNPLQAHSWSDNLRELRNLTERLMIATSQPLIDGPVLPDASLRPPPAEATRGRPRAGTTSGSFSMARLCEHGCNISRTASAGGLARKSLSQKLRALWIQVPRG